jgi:peptidoglycan hydrolase-like protein with peptidoglycan-binding domain
MPNYKIIESVGSGTQSVTDWDSIEPHHPSQRQQEPGRVYARINGNIEEVAGDYGGTAIYTPGGQLMVSKDFILQNSQNNSQNVPVPSPANGVIGEVDRRNGFVTILDRPGGEVMFQLRHMAIGQDIQPGTRVEYGQPLGTQSGYGRGDPNYYGTHVHIDANVKYLDQADRYIRDMANGVITTDTRPQNVENLVNAVPPIVQVSGNFPAPPVQALADGKIEFNERGPDVARLQEALRNAGALDNRGQQPGQDGHFGNQTREALLNYKQTYNQQHPDAPLPMTPVADQQTLAALGVIPPPQIRQDTPQQPQPSLNVLDDKAKALYQQIDKQLTEKLPVDTFKSEQERTNAALALTGQAYGKLSQASDVGLKDGVLAVSDGKLGDPASKSAHMKLEDAVKQTPEDSLRQIVQKQNEPQPEMAPPVQTQQQQRPAMQQ